MKQGYLFSAVWSLEVSFRSHQRTNALHIANRVLRVQDRQPVIRATASHIRIPERGVRLAINEQLNCTGRLAQVQRIVQERLDQLGLTERHMGQASLLIFLLLLSRGLGVSATVQRREHEVQTLGESARCCGVQVALQKQTQVITG